MDWINAAEDGLVAGSCERGNEPFVSMKHGFY
jgi:hypothetical protein